MSRRMQTHARNDDKSVFDSSKGSVENPFTTSEILQEFVSFEKQIQDGALAVFCDVKAASQESEVEVIDFHIVVPSRWSLDLQQRIEDCIDRFGVEKGVGKTRVVGEGTVT